LLITTIYPGAEINGVRYQGFTYNISYQVKAGADLGVPLGLAISPTFAILDEGNIALTATLNTSTSVNFGVVTFYQNGTSIGTASMFANSAGITLANTVPLGNNSFYAVWSGNLATSPRYLPITSSTINYEVRARQSIANMSLAINPNPAFSDGLTTFTANISAPSLVQGAVSFFANDILIGSSNITNNLASVVLPSLTTGTYTVKAVYPGRSIAPKYFAFTTSNVTYETRFSLPFPGSFRVSSPTPAIPSGTSTVIINATTTVTINSGTVIFFEDLGVTGGFNKDFWFTENYNTFDTSGFFTTTSTSSVFVGRFDDPVYSLTFTVNNNIEQTSYRLGDSIVAYSPSSRRGWEGTIASWQNKILVINPLASGEEGDRLFQKVFDPPLDSTPILNNWVFYPGRKNYNVKPFGSTRRLDPNLKFKQIILLPFDNYYIFEIDKQLSGWTKRNPSTDRLMQPAYMTSDTSRPAPGVRPYGIWDELDWGILIPYEVLIQVPGDSQFGYYVIDQSESGQWAKGERSETQKFGSGTYWTSSGTNVNLGGTTIPTHYVFRFVSGVDVLRNYRQQWSNTTWLNQTLLIKGGFFYPARKNPAAFPRFFSFGNPSIDFQWPILDFPPGVPPLPSSNPRWSNLIWWNDTATHYNYLISKGIFQIDTDLIVNSTSTGSTVVLGTSTFVNSNTASLTVPLSSLSTATPYHFISAQLLDYAFVQGGRYSGTATSSYYYISEPGF
jgi:hypothetical protein